MCKVKIKVKLNILNSRTTATSLMITAL